MSARLPLAAELKRRNVFRVGAAYLVVAWLLVEVSDTIFPRLGLPDWTVTLVIALLLLGLPVALFLAWAFELTPEGVKRTEEVALQASVTPQTGRVIDKMILVGMVVVVAVIVADRFLFKASDPGGTAREQAARSTAEGSGPAGSAIGDDPAEQLAPAVGTGAQRPEASSIAVLPFVNLSPDPENAYFADGISEELLNILAGVEGLKVASRTSAFSFKGKDTAIPEIARLLDVQHVLEGSVRKQGQRVRITAQLVEAGADAHLWSQTYERDLVDIFHVQEEIAQAIASALKESLGLRTVRVAVPTTSFDAYEEFLKGRQLFHQRDAGLIEARAHLEAAVRLDPEFALAWATLGAVHLTSPDYLDVSIAEAWHQAELAAEQARRLDDSLALPYAVLGRVRAMQDSDRIIELELLESAVGRDPGDSTSLLWLGVHYFEAGHLERAERTIAQALRVDPLAGVVQGWYGTVRGAQGHFDEARRHLLRAAESARWHAAFYRLSFLAAAEGNPGEAAAFLQRLVEDHPQPGLIDSRIVDAAIDALQDPEKKGQLYQRVSELGSDRRGGTQFLLLAGMQQEALDIELTESASARTRLFTYVWWPGQRSLAKRKGFMAAAGRRGLVAYWERHGYPDGCKYVEEPWPRLECTP